MGGEAVTGHVQRHVSALCRVEGCGEEEVMVTDCWMVVAGHSKGKENGMKICLTSFVIQLLFREYFGCKNFLKKQQQKNWINQSCEQL